MNAVDPARISPPSTPPLGVDLHVGALRYGNALLFEALDLRLVPGAITALLGPSGVGKSTLLRLLAGLSPGDNALRLACDDGHPLEGRIAYMAQNDLLLPWLTTLGNVLLGARLRGERPDRARAIALLRHVGLGDALGAFPATLSGGMRQRAALVRTLMEDRPVVLMDEPFGALDTITRHRLQGLAATLLAGRTVLLVTHDPAEALRLADRIHVLAGRPARLDAALVPPCAPPREPTDHALQPTHNELLRRLVAADAEGR